jgi:hypothetical protein
MRILAAVNRKLAEWKGLLRRQQRSRCRQPHRKRWQGTRLQQPCCSAKRQWSGSAKYNCISALEPQDSVRVLQHGGLRSSTPGTVGTTQRNSIFGPHFRDFDLSIFKNFPVTERATIQSVPRRSTSPTLRTSSSAITTSRTRSSARQPLVRSQQPIQTTTHGSTSSYSKYCSNLR